MTGHEVRAVFAELLPQGAMERLCRPGGVLERQRQLHLGMLGRAMVISAGTPGGASQADLWRASLASEGPQGTRAAFSRGFDAPLERFMEALAQRALASAQAQEVEVPGPRSGVQEWSIVDATTIKVRDARREEDPGTGDEAALKGQTVLSVGGGAPGQDHGSPAREPASPPLQIDASWRGYGVRADLADASLARLRACEPDDVRCVLGLTDHWKPKVASMARGQGTRACFPGTALEALLAEDLLRRDGRAMDADVPGGGGTNPLPRRLVGGQTPKGDGVFLTNLPPRIGPRQVADLYRVRWEVERSSTLETSVHRLDQIAAERPCSLTTRLHASLVASPIAAVLAHRHHLSPRPPQAGAARTEAPLHLRRLAVHMVVSSQVIAQAFELTGTAAKRRWDNIAAWLTQAGSDPHWRRRPSVLDHRRGWTRQPRCSG